MLTPNTTLVHTSFTYSKLNMDDFSVLTGLLGYLDSTYTRSRIEILPCANMDIFVTDFCNLGQKSSLY